MLGKETLIFCGTEWIIKDGIKNIVQIWGVFVLNNPFQVVCFSMGCLVISHYTIVTVLKKYVPQLVGVRSVVKLEK